MREKWKADSHGDGESLMASTINLSSWNQLTSKTLLIFCKQDSVSSFTKPVEQIITTQLTWTSCWTCQVNMTLRGWQREKVSVRMHRCASCEVSRKARDNSAHQLRRLTSVPPVVTCGPGQRAFEGIVQVEEGPDRKDDVVDVQKAQNHQGCKPDSWGMQRGLSLWAC